MEEENGTKEKQPKLKDKESKQSATPCQGKNGKKSPVRCICDYLKDLSQ